MPEMINGVPACYGGIERIILESPWACLRCDYKKCCAEYSKELKNSWNELLRMNCCALEQGGSYDAK